MNNKIINLSTFFCLYLARAIPATFIMTALQVTLRQHGIGLLSLTRLPWSIKFLWAPLIDRHCVTVGDFKKLIIATETVFAAAIFLVGFLDVAKNLTLIVALILLSTFAASVQNVTSDTLAVNAFQRGDHSAVTSMKSMGRYTGRLLGGGILIMVLHKYGWHTVVPVLGFFALLLILPIALDKHIKVDVSKKKKRATVSDFWHFFTQKHILPQVIFLFLFFAGFDGIMSMLKPWMVDMGYSMKQIGLYNGIIGTSVAFVMAAVAGRWVKRIGTRVAQRIVAVLAIFVPTYFLFITYTPPTLSLVLIGIILIRFVEACAAVTLYTTAMDSVRPGREGTDFTIQLVLVHLSGALTSVLSGGIGQWLDYRGLCLIELGIAIVSLVYIFGYYTRMERV